MVKLSNKEYLRQFIKYKRAHGTWEVYIHINEYNRVFCGLVLKDTNGSWIASKLPDGRDTETERFINRHQAAMQVFNAWYQINYEPV